MGWFNEEILEKTLSVNKEIESKCDLGTAFQTFFQRVFPGIITSISNVFMAISQPMSVCFADKKHG